MLPFDSFSQPQPVTIGDLTIPVFGCLTINEAMFLQGIQDDLLRDIQKSGILGDRLLQQTLATMLLVSRVAPTWTLADTQSLLSDEEVLALCLLFIKEKETTGGDRAKPSEDKDSDPIDWADLYWRLQQIYPHDERFNAANFGNCPISLVEQALKTIRRTEIERLSAESRAVANLATLFAAAHGAKNPQPRHYNDFEMLQFTEEARREIPPQAAEAFMTLHHKGRIPEWLYDFVDVEKMKASASTIG